MRTGFILLLLMAVPPPGTKSVPKAARNICRRQSDQDCYKQQANSVVLKWNMRKRAPRIAPTTDPKATGPAIGANDIASDKICAQRWPRLFTQIMKFEVADETLIGRRNARVHGWKP